MNSKYLVISYDSDEQQFFYDVVHAESAEKAKERVLNLRDYCVDADVMTVEAWLQELEAEKAERES